MAVSVDIEKKLHGFTLKVKLESDGSPMGILGASGSGKSMTLRCIAGIQTPDSGRIVVNDKVLFDSEKKINLKPQERKVGYLFQNYALFPTMTAANLASYSLFEVKYVSIKSQYSVWYLSASFNVLQKQSHTAQLLMSGTNFATYVKRSLHSIFA